MKRNDKQTKMLKARRDITPEETPKKNNRIKKILLSVLGVFTTIILLIAIAVLLMSPTIDTDRNPFNADIMTVFGKPEAYNFSNSYRLHREHNMGIIYTLEDFYGHGLLVGETNPEAVIRNKNSYNVMVVGKDRVGANTDVIMIVNFDALTQKVNILQIPRDTYVDDPINKNSSKRINAIYAFAYNKNIRKYSSAQEASHESLKYLESTLESTFGITIDNYFMIDLNGFVKIIDSIGGVEVDVPFDMYYNDDEQNLHIDLKKGKQTLNGNQSEQFVRFRNTYVYGDLGRVSAQKIFLAALVDKLLSPEWFSVESLTDIATNVIKYTTTGMTLSDLVGYVKKIDFGKLSSNSITFYTAQGESYITSSGASMYSLYLKENLEIINKAFNLYNKDVEADNVTLSEQYRSAYLTGNTQGSTASDIEKEPPKIIVAGGSSKPPSAEVIAPSDETDTDTSSEENDNLTEEENPAESEGDGLEELPEDSEAETEIPTEENTEEPLEDAENTEVSEDTELPSETETPIDNTNQDAEEDTYTEGEGIYG